jgi:hypothetical protein
MIFAAAKMTKRLSRVQCRRRIAAVPGALQRQFVYQKIARERARVTGV